VGFDAQPSHVFRDSGSGDKWHPDVKGVKRVGGGNVTVLDWTEHWAPLLRLPRVQTVVYARSNAVKMYVSKRHGRVLGDLCGGHKVIGGSTTHDAQRLCFERNRDALDAPLKIGAHELVAEAHRIGRNWAALLEDARAASGRERFPIFFYEALQRDAAEELGRLFHVIKLSAPGLKLPHHQGGPASTSVKVTRDDLSQGVIQDFPKLARDLARLDPCLAPQLHDKIYETFPELCGTRTSFADYDVSPIPACNASRPGRAPWVVFTQQRSGSRWFVDTAGERSGVEPALSLRVRELSLRPGTYGHRPELDICDGPSAACDCAVKKLFDEERRMRPGTDAAPGFKYMWQPSEIGDGTASRLDGLLRGLCALDARILVYERRNVLRRFISAASNNVDRGAAPVGEGHVHKMAHPKDQAAAARVRSFRPTLDAGTLKDRIATEVADQARLVGLLGRSCDAWDVAPRVHYYEDLVDASPRSSGRRGSRGGTPRGLLPAPPR